MAVSSLATAASACTAASAATSASSAKSRPASASACAFTSSSRHELVERPRPAFGLRDGLARLRLGLGGDEIGKALDLGEIDAPVLEGAPRELAWLGQPHASERSERIDDPPDHGAAAMNVQLGDVLAGEARRPRQPERKPAIEHLAGSRALDLAQARLARRRRRTAKLAERIARPRPRDADDRDPGSARRARQRADGVALGHEQPAPPRRRQASSDLPTRLRYAVFWRLSGSIALF